MKKKNMIAATMCMSLLAGCGTSSSTTSTTSVSSDKTINIAVMNDMTTMDTSLMTDETSFNMASLCQSGLTQFGEDKEVHPDLAESWDVSDDGLTYTFHLRDGIQWSNGEAITANDFVYGFRRLVDPNTASEYSYIMSSLNVVNADAVISGEKSVEELGVEAEDDQTFVVHLTVPSTVFISCMTNPQFYPLNEEFVEEQGDQYALTPENMLYSGVYTMTDWSSGNHYTFTHNDAYWDEENYPQETINVELVQETQTATLMYESGSLDFLTLTGEMVEQYKDTEGYQAILTSGIWWLAPNMEDEYLSNENLRKAISYSINREELTENVLKTGAVEADGLIAKDLVSSSDGTDFRDIAGDYTEYDPDKASEYYKKAVEELGKDAVIEIMYDDAADSSKVATTLEQMITECCEGITVTLSSNPKKTRISKMLEHDFSIGLTRWVPDYADPQSYLDIMMSTASMNFGSYNNAEFDALEMKATRGEDSTDVDKRFNDLVEAERILIEEDQGIIPLYQEGGAVLVNPDVTGYIPLVLGTGTWRHMTKA